MSTYQAIKALPAKGFDWAGFNAALLERVETICLMNKRTLLSAPEWRAATGLRQMRTAAMEMAARIVSELATRSARLAPSEETLAWGGFLGGSVEVWTDKAAEDAAIVEIVRLSQAFRR